MASGLCLVTVLLVILRTNVVSGVTIPAVPGSTITLTCNKIPSTNLIWEHWDSKRIVIRSGVVTNSATSSKYVVTQRQDSESVAVSSVTLSDDGEYRCYYSTNPADAQVMNINVLGIKIYLLTYLVDTLSMASFSLNIQIVFIEFISAYRLG